MKQQVLYMCNRAFEANDIPVFQFFAKLNRAKKYIIR